MFKIFRFVYIDRNARIKWEIFARNVSLADQLASRITNLGIHSLKRKRIGFCKPVLTEWPPYELEQAQVEYVEEMEQMAISKQSA